MSITVIPFFENTGAHSSEMFFPTEKIATSIGCFITSYLQGYRDQEKAIDLSGINFSTSKAFNINTLIIVFVLTLIYVTLG